MSKEILKQLKNSQSPEEQIEQQDLINQLTKEEMIDYFEYEVTKIAQLANQLYNKNIDNLDILYSMLDKQKLDKVYDSLTEIDI